MPADATRMLRGALAGGLAAGVWAAQQPLDRRLFGVDYDDAELLGSAITGERGTPATYALGAALHVVNGALFGAVLGTLEERLNPPPGEAAPAEDDHSTSNGHGNVEHLVVARS